MDILPTSDLLKHITSQDLIEYLRALGWKNVESPKATWVVYAGPDDYYGEPLEIVLSRKEDTRTAYEYLARAVDLLSALHEEPSDKTVQRIQNVNRDVLSIRNIAESIRTSIPLRLAARQIANLRTMIKQASHSETDAQPHYRSDYSSSLALRMVNNFQFAHTQNRSFGLVIQSPILSDPTTYQQLSLFAEPEEIKPVPPIERRITERVIRGLAATKHAVRQQSVDFLVNSYGGGFSSNMAEAIVKISPDRRASVEYSVLWSPKIAPSEDVAETESILLNGTDYAFLEDAASKMKDLQPEDTFTVSGQVSSVSTTDDPGKLDTGRSVVVKWVKPDTGRVIHLIIELGRSDYLNAVDAHKNWYPIEVTGEARLIGNRWRLLNPRDFRVNPPEMET